MLKSKRTGKNVRFVLLKPDLSGYPSLIFPYAKQGLFYSHRVEQRVTRTCSSGCISRSLPQADARRKLPFSDSLIGYKYGFLKPALKLGSDALG